MLCYECDNNESVKECTACKLPFCEWHRIDTLCTSCSYEVVEE